MLYRAVGEYDYYISRIGYAKSTNGFQFTRRDKIAICQTEDYEIYGMEDPRITQIEDKIFITYVVLSDYVKNHPKIYSALTVTKDYYKFAKLGIISSNFDNNKDVIFFPEKFTLGDNLSNSYLKLHRPKFTLGDNLSNSYLKLHLPNNWNGSNSNFLSIKPSIWLSISDSEFTLTDSILLLKPEQDWEELKIGAGPSPIKTKDGWLLIYHGVNNDKIYRVGAAILDLKYPRKVIARTKIPLLEPTEKYEKIGDVNNVIFPTGIAVMDKKLLLYYGGADKVCCVASASIDELIEYIMKDRIGD